VKSISGNNVTLESNGVVSGQSMKGIQNGQIIIDAPTGLIKEGNFEIKMEGPVSNTSRIIMKGSEQ
jgi:hypothetical protein